MTKPRPIWIDTDIVFNQFAQDVDDGLALLMALDCPRVVVRGISLNRRVDNGFAVTQRLLAHYARYPVPVHKGTDDVFASYGQSTPAVEALAEALREEPLTIVAIGAATNLANLLHFYPELAPQIQEIVFCAGRRQGQSFFAERSRKALPDANFDNDPASMIKVLDAGVPIVLAGFEAASELFIDAADIRRIRRRGRPGDRWVAQRLSVWLWVWRLGLRLNRFIPFDAATIGHVLYPEYCQYLRGVRLGIQRRANDAPRWKAGAQKDYLEVGQSPHARWRVDYVTGLSPDYKQRLMAHLLGEAVPAAKPEPAAESLPG